MISHQQMVNLYGPENVVTLATQEVELLELHLEDAQVLTTVGLPRHQPPFFTTEVEGGPEFLRAIDVSTHNGKEHREVIIGGPPGDPDMRFTLSAYERFIMLVQFEGTTRGEVANNDLPEFVEFLYRIEEHSRRTAADPTVKQESLDDLRNVLMDLNPVAFELSEDWWVMALNQLSGGGMGL